MGRRPSRLGEDTLPASGKTLFPPRGGHSSRLGEDTLPASGKTPFPPRGKRIPHIIPPGGCAPIVFVHQGFRPWLSSAGPTARVDGTRLRPVRAPDHSPGGNPGQGENPGFPGWMIWPVPPTPGASPPHQGFRPWLSSTGPTGRVDGTPRARGFAPGYHPPGLQPGLMVPRAPGVSPLAIIRRPYRPD